MKLVRDFPAQDFQENNNPHANLCDKPKGVGGERQTKVELYIT